MSFIAANGLLVLVPCAIILNRWAGEGAFGTAFYVGQGIELLAGAINLTLMGLNVRDGLRMAGRLRVTPSTVAGSSTVILGWSQARPIDAGATSRPP